MPLTGSKVHNLDDLEPPKMLKNLLKQKTEGIFCDIKLCLQGSVTWGHACVLAPLSSYIMEHFRTNSDSNHWCPQKPLVIDLDRMTTVSQDKCALCLSTLVDFMYSQDLIILDGHLQHFSKMIYYLKIIDLFPFINTFISDGNLTSLIEEPNNQESPVNSISDNDLLKTAQNDRSAKLLTPMPKRDHLTNSLLCNISEITNSYKEQPNHNNQLNTSQELNQSHDNSDRLPTSSENFHSSVSLTLQNCNVNENVNVIVEEHNYGSRDVSTLKPKCEFLCCSGEVVPSKSSLNHRRKISCEMCSFTAVSVKKVLKHIECVGHLGTMCPICTQKFQNTDSLQQHLKDHNNSKPYLCQFCSKRIKFWEFYKIHLKVHCRNKKLCCEICQKSFKSEINLKVHLKSHTKSYLCSSCSYLTPDADAFKAHLLIHSEREPSVNTDLQYSYDNFNHISDTDLIKHKTAKQFLCNSCGEGFTQKSNLKRHTELKHSNVPNFNCVKCTYVTKRSDLLKIHMKRHHNCLPEEVKCPSRRITKRISKSQNLDKDQSEVVGVLIPVQLVSTNDSSTLNVFAVKTCVNGVPESEGDNPRKKLKLEENVRSVTSISAPKMYPLSNSLVQNESAFADNSRTKINSSLETMQTMPCLNDVRSVEDSSDLLLGSNEECLENSFTGKVQQIDMSVNNLQPNSNAGDKIIDVTQPVLNISQEFNDFQIALEEENKNLNRIKVVESDLLARSGEFWLNEATGEFLNENSLVNVQVIDTRCRFNAVSSSAENLCKDPIDPLHHTLILSDTSQTILDLRDEVDEFKSNPQTPQTNLVEVDDPDNLFPWSCIDNNFCSTWVLNEATGELNMVSFNVQPIKHSDESKLDENTGMFSPRDDDETALFLNEGTGDLSVIYFNPSKRECDSSKQLYNELGTQDIPDNVSEHSNDEDDFLNAEFFKATASFMAHKGNETFLNELTGEFDTNIADFSNYHPDMMENQISGSESYLNEETGEILWNVLNKNVGSDFFTNSESFKYDLDDSLNCDDFEPFAEEINDFSAQFSLETKQDWRSVDETCDILLNECTGELVKKS